MFVDHAKFTIRSGKGGAGCASFRREKFVELGGPDGGDGGNGGNVYFQAQNNTHTLAFYSGKRLLKASSGEQGSSRKKHGKKGEDLVLIVPPGTSVIDADSGELLLDMINDGEKKLILKGGKGGLGNVHFKNSVNQAPTYAQPGEPMQEMTVIMELKLLADVGLVGLPNAGKSTLLSSLSSAKPKIANYPFTTLEPSLGIVAYRDHQSFVMADIPGIIEGAAEGKGLGLRFLRHIERNSLLLFMVPGDTDDIKKEYELLLNELEKFNPDMLQKHRVLAVTKCDLLDEELMEMLRETLPEDLPVVFISSVTGFGLNDLKDVLWKELNAESNKIAGVIAEDTIVHRDKDLSYLAAEVYDEDRDADEEIFGTDDGEEDDFEDFDDDEIEYIDEGNVEDVDDEGIEYIDESEIEDLDDFEYEEPSEPK